MNSVEKKVLNILRKQEWRKIIKEESKRTDDSFLVLFMALFNQLTHVTIVDKNTLENVLTGYCDMPEFKSLFENIVVTNEDVKRVDFGNLFITSNSSSLLTIKESRSGRCFISLLDDNRTTDIISSYGSDKVTLMSMLIMQVYPRYIREVDYPELEITEQTRGFVIKHPDKHLNCPSKVFMGKFYTDEEWEERSRKILSTQLPGTGKSRVNRKSIKSEN